MPDDEARHHRHGKDKKKHCEKKRHGDVMRDAGGALTPFSETGEGHHRAMALLGELCQRPANKLCADCKETGTQWASVSLGVFLCIRCAGFHRSLGTHISKVKSTTMDTWTTSEVRVMQAVGNEYGGKLYEARIPSSLRMQPVITDTDRRTRIEKKYVTGEFADPKAEKKLLRAVKALAGVSYDNASCHSSSTPSGPTTSSAKPTRAVVEQQRAAALQSIYGDRVEIKAKKQRQTTRSEEEEGDGNADYPLIGKGKNRRDARKKRHKQPALERGAFGLVNVPEGEERREKLRNLFQCFGIMWEEESDKPPAPPAAPAADASAAAGLACGGDESAAVEEMPPGTRRSDAVEED